MESNGREDDGSSFRSRSNIWHGKVKIEPGLESVIEEDRTKRNGLFGKFILIIIYK